MNQDRDGGTEAEDEANGAANGAAAIADIYQRRASQFDARRRSTPFIEAQWLARFRALLSPRGRVLDLGCGSGFPIAAHLIDHGFEIEGVDIAEAMIELCQQSWPGQTWRVGDMRTVDFRGPYDGALAWHSSFHLSGIDQAELIKRIGPALAAGAPFMFTTGHDEGVAWGDMLGDRLFHASLSPSQFEDAIKTAELTVVERIFNDPDCGGAAVWLTQKC